MKQNSAVYVKVHSFHQSPLNKDRWMFVLSCGHELWVTRLRRPSKTGGRALCPTCTKGAVPVKPSPSKEHI